MAIDFYQAAAAGYDRGLKKEARQALARRFGQAGALDPQSYVDLADIELSQLKEQRDQDLFRRGTAAYEALRNTYGDIAGAPEDAQRLQEMDRNQQAFVDLAQRFGPGPAGNPNVLAAMISASSRQGQGLTPYQAIRIAIDREKLAIARQNAEQKRRAAEEKTGKTIITIPPASGDGQPSISAATADGQWPVDPYISSWQPPIDAATADGRPFISAATADGRRPVDTAKVFGKQFIDAATADGGMTTVPNVREPLLSDEANFRNTLRGKLDPDNRISVEDFNEASSDYVSNAALDGKDVHDAVLTVLDVYDPNSPQFRRLGNMLRSNDPIKVAAAMNFINRNTAGFTGLPEGEAVWKIGAQADEAKQSIDKILAESLRLVSGLEYVERNYFKLGKVAPMEVISRLFGLTDFTQSAFASVGDQRSLLLKKFDSNNENIKAILKANLSNTKAFDTIAESQGLGSGYINDSMDGYRRILMLGSLLGRGNVAYRLMTRQQYADKHAQNPELFPMPDNYYVDPEKIKSLIPIRGSFDQSDLTPEQIQEAQQLIQQRSQQGGQAEQMVQSFPQEDASDQIPGIVSPADGSPPGMGGLPPSGGRTVINRDSSGSISPMTQSPLTSPEPLSTSVAPLVGSTLSKSDFRQFKKIENDFGNKNVKDILAGAAEHQAAAGGGNPFALGVGQAATFGFSTPLMAWLRGEDLSDAIAREDKIAADNPLKYITGSILGGIAFGLVTAGGLALAGAGAVPAGAAVAGTLGVLALRQLAQSGIKALAKKIGIKNAPKIMSAVLASKIGQKAASLLMKIPGKGLLKYAGLGAAGAGTFRAARYADPGEAFDEETLKIGAAGGIAGRWAAKGIQGLWGLAKTWGREAYNMVLPAASRASSAMSEVVERAISRMPANSPAAKRLQNVTKGIERVDIDEAPEALINVIAGEVNKYSQAKDMVASALKTSADVNRQQASTLADETVAGVSKAVNDSPLSKIFTYGGWRPNEGALVSKDRIDSVQKGFSKSFRDALGQNPGTVNVSLAQIQSLLKSPVGKEAKGRMEQSFEGIRKILGKELELLKGKGKGKKIPQSVLEETNVPLTATQINNLIVDTRAIKTNRLIGREVVEADKWEKMLIQQASDELPPIKMPGDDTEFTYAQINNMYNKMRAYGDGVDVARKVLKSSVSVEEMDQTINAARMKSGSLSDDFNLGFRAGRDDSIANIARRQERLRLEKLANDKKRMDVLFPSDAENMLDKDNVYKMTEALQRANVRDQTANKLNPDAVEDFSERTITLIAKSFLRLTGANTMFSVPYQHVSRFLSKNHEARKIMADAFVRGFTFDKISGKLQSVVKGTDLSVKGTELSSAEVDNAAKGIYSLIKKLSKQIGKEKTSSLINSPVFWGRISTTQAEWGAVSNEQNAY